jgi:hypothetical protein
MGRPLNKRFFDPVPSSNGEGVVSYTFSNRGSYTALPTVTVSPPGLPGGVTATGTLTMRALSAVVPGGGGGTGYQVNDVLTVVGAGTAATFKVLTLTGDAVATVELVSAGSYTALATNPRTTTVAPAGGTGATLTVTYEVLNFTVTVGGSGYVNDTDAALTFSPASTTASTAVLTTTGTNVILATAFVVGGTAPLDADIIKQTSTNEYLMQTTEGQSVVTLVADDTPVEGQASITATDALGETYWVMKLTSRLALLERKGGAGVYESGENAPWTLEATSIDPTGQTVQITSA